MIIDGFAAWNNFPDEVKQHFTGAFAADRIARAKGEKPATMKVTEVLPQPDSKDFFLGFHQANPTNAWRDETTLRSVEAFVGCGY